MGKFYFAFAWHIIVNLHVCICKNKICIWSDPGVNLPICKYTPVCICVRMRHLLTPSKICTPEYIYTCVFLAHANWTLANAFNTIYKLTNTWGFVQNDQSHLLHCFEAFWLVTNQSVPLQNPFTVYQYLMSML